MFGLLYVITNNVNDKVYVGKTYDSLDNRFKQHKQEAKRFPHRPLYAAMNKYGADNFAVTLLDTLEEDILEVEEQKTVKLFNSYNYGYNATLGGDGKRYLDISDKEIIDTYQQSQSLSDCGRKLGICKETISKVLKNNGLEPRIVSSSKLRERAIFCSTLGIAFVNSTDCGNYFIDNKIAKSSDLHTVRSGIYRVLNNRRSSYLKHKVEYIWEKLGSGGGVI